MNAEEAEIYDFLKHFPNVFVSVIEISKSVGARRNYLTDRTWARPILRRMEMDGHLESSPSGDYRLKRDSGNTTTFLKALGQPNIVLGDTTIICLDDIKRQEDDDEDDQKPEKRQAC